MDTLSPTAETILRTARSLIVIGGYDSFSYADIAGIVGIRKASIHHHFPSKADLVRVLVARYRDEAGAALATLDQRVPAPAARLRAYAGYWAACIADGTAPICVCALLASQLPALPDTVAHEVRLHFEALTAWVGGVLACGAGTGHLRLGGTPAAEAAALVAVVHGAMLSARAHGDAGLFRTIVDPTLNRLIG